MKRRHFLASAAAMPFMAHAAIPYPINTWEAHRRPRDYLATSAVTTEPPNIDDRKLVERIMKAYQSSFKREHYVGGPWFEIFTQRLGKEHNVFMGKDVSVATALLRDPSPTYMHEGFEETYLPLARMFADPKNAEEYASLCKMQLVTLGEALGVERLDNPETYDVATIKPRTGPNTESLLLKLDGVMGFNIQFSNPIKNQYGMHTARGVAAFRAIQALYQAHKIRRLVNVRNPRLMELGAGIGKTAYYCWQAGIKNYTIVDLPFTAISSAYYLGRTLGDNAITLEGENPKSNTIRIMSPETFHSTYSRYDLIINVDSITEMPLGIARDYWQSIKRRTRKFWSMNHESNQFTVSQIVEMKPATRNPAWMRKGYTEELYLM